MVKVVRDRWRRGSLAFLCLFFLVTPASALDDGWARGTGVLCRYREAFHADVRSKRQRIIGYWFVMPIGTKEHPPASNKYRDEAGHIVEIEYGVTMYLLMYDNEKKQSFGYKGELLFNVRTKRYVEPRFLCLYENGDPPSSGVVTVDTVPIKQFIPYNGAFDYSHVPQENEGEYERK